MVSRKHESARRKYGIDKKINKILAQGREATIKEIRTIAKRVNERYRQLEKANISQTSYAYRLTQESSSQDFLTRGKKVRYSLSKKRLESMTDEQLKEYLYDIESKYASKTTSLKGLKALNEERFQKSKERLKALIEDDGETKFNVTNDELRNIINSGVFSLHDYDSTQLIEDWQEYKKQGLTINQFLEKIEEYNNIDDKSFNYIGFIKNLKKIV